MRIRSTKPEFWKSRRVASVSWDARLVLKGLESYVDDNGVGVDDIELIVTDVFPRDMFANGSDTVARVSEAISELHRAGLLHRYEGPDDDLLYVSFWESIQRIDKPGAGRNPRPDGTFNYKASEIRESVARPPVTLAPGTGEQGNRGTGEKDSCSPAPRESDSPTRFDEFWAAFPRKVGKQTAQAKYKAAVKRSSEDAVIAGAHALAQDPNLPEPKFIPHPTTWLERNGWEDEPLPTRYGTNRANDRMRAGFDAMASYAGPTQDPWTQGALEA